MKKYPKIGIRPTIDGRQGGVRESLEEKTMNLAKAVAELITSNLKNGDGSPVECVISDSTIGRVAESAACAEKFERKGVGSTITVTSCWCYGAETMDMNPYYPKAVWGQKQDCRQQSQGEWIVLLSGMQLQADLEPIICLHLQIF